MAELPKDDVFGEFGLFVYYKVQHHDKKDGTISTLEQFQESMGHR